MRRIGAPEWRLMVDAKLRNFSDRTHEKMAAWVAEMQAAGKPVLVLLPSLVGVHWWLAARRPLTASPSAVRLSPQAIIAADDFTLLWRLAEPVTTERANALVARMIGSVGKPANGEP